MEQNFFSIGEVSKICNVSRKALRYYDQIGLISPDYINEENGDPETFGNARGVRNCFEHILVAQNNRLAAMESVTKDDLMTIIPDDVLYARGKLD